MELTKELEEYIIQHSTPESELLKELYRETFLRTALPNMISGHLQGLTLQMLCRLVKPKLALEIGTFTGYATLNIAMGLNNESKLISVDNNEENLFIAQKYISRSNYLNRIELVHQDGLEYIQNTTLSFDYIFVDADKKRYPEYYKATKRVLNTGGLLIFDNVLWKGKVITENTDGDTAAIKELNALIANDLDYFHFILPLRDGLQIVQKIR